MLLLTRYLLSLFLRNLLLALSAFCGIYLLIDFFEKVDDFIEVAAPVPLYFAYFLGNLPMIVVQVIPLAMLMAAFMTIGGLSRTGELTAMRAGGMSLLRITRPLLAAAVVLTVLVILLQELVLPLTTSATRDIFDRRVRGKQELLQTRDQVWLRVDNQILHIGQALPKSGELHQVAVYTLDEQFRVTKRIDAKSASFAENAWTLHDATSRSFNPDTGEMTGSGHADQAPLALAKTPEDFSSADPKQWELSFTDLRRLVRQSEREGTDPTRYRVDMHAHLSSPFACLIMVLLGIPFALQRGRNSSLALGIVISIVTGVSYFILHSIAMAFGYSGILPAPLATWATNILFGLAGIWLVLFRRS